MPVEEVDQLFVDYYERTEVEESEEICIPNVGWVNRWTEEAREYLENRESNQAEDDGAVAPGFHTEAGIDAFLLENPDSLEVISEGQSFCHLQEEEWAASVYQGSIREMLTAKDRGDMWHLN